jgi:putative oxygen-independent coproporphyrinogen III oxidase
VVTEPSLSAAPGSQILPPLTLYVHIPWCVRKCPYCDFNSHEVKGTLPEDAYIDALLADLKQDVALAQGRILESIFVGGGTPSLLSPEAIERLLCGVRRVLPVSPEAEITVEANPGTVERGALAEMRAAGVNRLSVGVQSFEDDLLRSIGRVHGRAEAIAAAEAAQQVGFQSYNLDLMFGLPGQSPAQALADIRTAAALEPPHLSYYQLTIEPNTRFARFPPKLPEEDVIWQMQQRAVAELVRAGYRRYEVSAYARAGHRCRHNLNYWLFGDYLGIGAGAHDKLTGSEGIRRRWKVKHPQAYLSDAPLPVRVAGERRPADREAVLEFMMNALRLDDGFPTRLLTERTGVALISVEPTLECARARGLLEWDAAQVRATARGLRYLNDLLALFLP